MLSSFSSRLLFFLLVDQLGQRTRHGVERLAQRRHLIVAAQLDAMAQVALVHVNGRAIELCDRCGHAAREANANVEGNDLNQPEKRSNRKEDVAPDQKLVAQGGEQGRVQHGRPGDHSDSTGLLLSRLPVNHVKQGAGTQLKVEPAGARGHQPGVHFVCAHWFLSRKEGSRVMAPRRAAVG